MSRRIRPILFFVYWTMLTAVVAAQSRYEYDIPLPAFDKDSKELLYRGKTLHSFLINPYTGALYSAPPDTLSTLFHDQVKAESRSIVMAYLGNLRSPCIDIYTTKRYPGLFGTSQGGFFTVQGLLLLSYSIKETVVLKDVKSSLILLLLSILIDE